VVFYFWKNFKMPYKINLNNFEQIIDTRILERGFEIYKNDLILSIEQIDKGIWEAIVSGSEDYEVMARVTALGNIIDSSCSCPYDMGRYCKHEVAIFNFLKYSDEAKKSSSDKMQRVRNILDTFTQEDLKENLLFILKNNRDVRNDFLEENE